MGMSDKALHFTERAHTSSSLSPTCNRLAVLTVLSSLLGRLIILPLAFFFSFLLF